MAHKKAAGSTSNVRDSQPKYLGVKKFGGEKVIAGNIIVRQKGLKMKPGQNVYAGRDFTLHASIDGVVKFTEKRAPRFDRQPHKRTYVNVETALVSAEETPAKAPIKVEAKATAE